MRSDYSVMVHLMPIINGCILSHMHIRQTKTEDNKPANKQNKVYLHLVSLAEIFLTVAPVLAVGLLEHVPAADLGLEAGADEEGAAHLTVQRIGLLRGRRRIG